FFQAEDGIRDKLVTGVQTCALPISNTIQKRAESSPVRMAVVAFTMASSAGMENGNNSSGSMISRLRVRIDMAAKNVPFTTSAQVPSAATGINCHAGPSARS